MSLDSLILKDFCNSLPKDFFKDNLVSKDDGYVLSFPLNENYFCSFCLNKENIDFEIYKIFGIIAISQISKKYNVDDFKKTLNDDYCNFVKDLYFYLNDYLDNDSFKKIA